MPTRKKPTKQRKVTVKADVVVASRAPLVDQALAKVRAAVEAVLDFADETADKLTKTLKA